MPLVPAPCAESLLMWRHETHFTDSSRYSAGGCQLCSPSKIQFTSENEPCLPGASEMRICDPSCGECMLKKAITIECGRKECSSAEKLHTRKETRRAHHLSADSALQLRYDPRVEDQPRGGLDGLEVPNSATGRGWRVSIETPRHHACVCTADSSCKNLVRRTRARSQPQSLGEWKRPVSTHVAPTWGPCWMGKKRK